MSDVFIVMTPGWEQEFDSVWSTEELAQARADMLDPYPDKDGVRWGLVSCVALDGDPEADDYMTGVNRPGNTEALAKLARVATGHPKP